MEILAIFSIICAISRCVIFKKRDVRWWQGIIPFYSVYKMGKICNAKKLGLINAISQAVLAIYFFFCFGFELYLVSEYTMNIDAQTFTQAYVVVPENIANIAIWSKYILVAMTAIAFGFWCMLSWQIIKVHQKNSWWILIWAIIPTISYAALAVSNDVYIDGKLYTSERVLSNKIVKSDDTSKKKLKRVKKK